MASSLPPGTAAIKPEFLISTPSESLPIALDLPDDDAIESSSVLPYQRKSCPENDGEPPAKKQKLSGAQKKKLAREESAAKKKNKGMNTNRKFARVHDEVQLCWKAAVGAVCDLGTSCKFSHDIPAYLLTKPPDIQFPLSSSISASPPFVSPLSQSEAGDPASSTPSVCPIFSERGACTQGYKCRFLSGHIRPSDVAGSPPCLVTDFKRQEATSVSMQEVNIMTIDRIKKIRSRLYPTPTTDAYLTELSRQPQEPDREEEPSDIIIPSPVKPVAPLPAADPIPFDTLKEARTEGPSDDSPDVPIRAEEKKRLRWKGLTYLAPLTTVGNLPFRRLCLDFGADITCGEMALATSLLGGNKEEWSLIRKHPSENIFGVQIAGNKPASLGRIAEVLATELGPSGTGLGALGLGNGIDFVDVNCGCPIDMVFKSGAGSALLDAPGRLGKSLIGMNRALGDIPLTIKVRTGVKDGKNTAHRLMPRLDGWGVSAVTIHGRTRQQRYTKLADWSYIKQCVDVLRIASNADDDLPSIPIFGGGDVYTSQGYWETLEESGVDGIMIGRGALIKPWIFTEIKERREWDISSRERLDIVRKYAEYGLNHWGSDTQGINATRRFLCESLSFQTRYIPLGILETQRPKLNDRAPAFHGRDQLETLLSSTDSQDWVKISEMFLGKAPEGWHFTPKHKSNSTADEGNG